MMLPMHLPPPAAYPSDSELVKKIISTCENIVQYGDNAESSFRNQVYLRRQYKWIRNYRISILHLHLSVLGAISSPSILNV